MASFSKAMIIGNLGRDPEMRYTPNGRPVTEFSVAVNQSTKNQQSGEWVEATDWFRITVWGDRAERTAENLRKGNRVFVEGRFRTREFEGRDGQKRISLEITADNVVSLEARARDEEGSFNAPSGGFGGGEGGAEGGGGGAWRRWRRRWGAVLPSGRPARPAATTTSTTCRSDPDRLTLPAAASRQADPFRRLTRRPGCPPSQRSATTTTATAVGGRSAPSAPTRRS